MYLMNKLVTTNSEEANGVINMIILRSIISLKMTEGFTSKYVKQHMGFFCLQPFTSGLLQENKRHSAF